MKTVIKNIRGFRRDRKGSFAIIAGISMPVVLLMAFGAVDYSMYASTKQELKAAANAATLAAVNDAQIAYVAREDVDLAALIKTRAEDVFRSRTAGIPGTANINFDVTSVVENNLLSVNLGYTASVKSNAFGIVGHDSYPVSDAQRARVSVRSYINFNFLFDVSASMGVGATHDDMVIMKSAVGCAFSCHLRAPRGSSTYDRARNAGATMRIDVARQAAKDAIDLMTEKSEVTDHMRVGLSIYDNVYSSYISTSDAMSSNLTGIKTLVDDAVQMRMSYGGSNTQLGIETLAANLPISGSGRTADDRIEYIIVLTDGVENPQALPDGSGWIAHPDATPNTPFKKFANHEYEYAPAASSCDVARAKGIQVFFINTEYLVPEWGQSAHNTKRFGFIEDTLHDLIPQRMAECAGSEDNVFTATSPQEIRSAFVDIIGELSSPLRLY